MVHIRIYIYTYVHTRIYSTHTYVHTYKNSTHTYVHTEGIHTHVHIRIRTSGAMPNKSILHSCAYAHTYHRVQPVLLIVCIINMYYVCTYVLHKNTVLGTYIRIQMWSTRRTTNTCYNTQQQQNCLERPPEDKEMVMSVYVHAYMHVHKYTYVYSEFSLIRHNSFFQRIWWINEFGVLTGYSLVLVHYVRILVYWEIVVD